MVYLFLGYILWKFYHRLMLSVTLGAMFPACLLLVKNYIQTIAELLSVSNVYRFFNLLNWKLPINIYQAVSPMLVRNYNPEINRFQFASIILELACILCQYLSSEIITYMETICKQNFKMQSSLLERQVLYCLLCMLGIRTSLYISYSLWNIFHRDRDLILPVLPLKKTLKFGECARMQICWAIVTLES